MANSGQWLETLVKELEENLLPDGFTVTTRERVYNESQHQIAEFDIVIRGKLGSGQINWLIECRDRGSSGAAPASWIEQLVARRGRFKFNQVTAVSTSGFSEGAIEYANEERIELRTVNELSYESIAEWLRFQHIDCLEHFGDLKNLDIRLDDSTTEEELQCAKELIESSDHLKPIFTNPMTGEQYSINYVFLINTFAKKEGRGTKKKRAFVVE